MLFLHKLVEFMLSYGVHTESSNWYIVKLIKNLIKNYYVKQI